MTLMRAALPWEERAAVVWLRHVRGLPMDSAEARVLQWRRWPFHWQRNHPRLWAAASRASFAFFGGLTKLFYRVGCRKVTVTGTEHLHVLRDRPAKRGIISVSNHPSTLDDPGMWGILPWTWFFGDPHRLRWTAVADDICHRRLLSSVFFGLAQGVPVVRGAGVYQPAVDWLLRALSDEGAWVHFFAEGRVNQTPELLRFKWGVGRLLLEASPTPLLLPIYLRGFERMKPLGRPVPRLGQHLEIHLGAPVDLSERLRHLSSSQAMDERRALVAQWVQQAVQAVAEQAPPRTGT